MKKHDLEQIKQIVQETVKGEVSPLEERLIFLEQKSDEKFADLKSEIKDARSTLEQKIDTNHMELKDKTNHLEQKTASNHREVMAGIAQVKKMETEDVNAFAGDVENLKHRVTKLEKVVYT